MSARQPERLEQILLLQADSRPGHPAVVCGEQALTYAELERASAALGGALADAGAGPGERVGLYLPKGVGSVVAAYAVLRTGAAYVPLDPTGPVGRALGIARRAGLRIVVLGVPQARRLAAADEAELRRSGLEHALVLLEGARDAQPPPVGPLRVASLSLRRAVAYQGEGPSAAAGGDDTAYILYTSGSTGEPKGVCISHSSSLFFVRWAAEFAGLTPEDRCSNHAPLFFDLSVFDIYSAMLAGGTTVVVPAAMSAFPRSLAAYIEQQRMTVWYSVPSTRISVPLYLGKITTSPTSRDSSSSASSPMAITRACWGFSLAVSGR